MLTEWFFFFFFFLCGMEKSNQSCSHLDLRVCPPFNCAQHKDGILWSSSLNLPALVLLLCVRHSLQLCPRFLLYFVEQFILWHRPLFFFSFFFFMVWSVFLKNSSAPDLALKLSNSSKQFQEHVLCHRLKNKKSARK